MGSIRVVFDTNVLVSAIGFGGKPWECLVRALVGDIQMITAAGALDEFERVIGYDRLPFTDTEQARYPELLRAEATVIEPSESFRVINEDPDDNQFLEIAADGNAAYIVSGDPHLTSVGRFRGIDIVTPATFLDLIDDHE